MNDWFDAEQRAERAQQLTEARRWREALSEIDAALEVNPTNVLWLGQRAFLLDQLENFEEAVSAYEEALKVEPQEKELLLRLAIDLARVGRFSTALDTFHRLTDHHPDYEPGYCFQIAAYAELGQHEKAEEAFYLAQQLKDDCPQCFFHMGLSLAERSEFKKAIYCWNRVLELDPEFEGVKGLIARGYRGMSDFEKSEEFYLAAIREEPGEIDLLYEMGDLLAETGNLNGAMAKFRQVIELEPDHADAHFALGHVSLQADDAETALTCFDRVREFDPDRAGLDLQQGSACLRLGRLKDARRHLKRAAVNEPENRDALMLLGNCLLRLHEPKPAADVFRSVLALDAELPHAHHNLGVCCFMLGQHALGIEHCRRAIELKPDYRIAIIKCALGYQRLGQFGEARAMIEYGLGIDPENAFLGELRARLWRVRIRYIFGRIFRFWPRSQKGRASV